MEKKLSCGFIIKDNLTGKYLGCVPTGSKDGLCDIPKGCKDEGESYLECALRELKEETGIDPQDALKDYVELGLTPYLRYKDLYLFMAFVDVDLSKLHCDSTFEQYGRQLPEMCDYKLGDLDIFRPIMKTAIETAFEL